MVTRKNTGVPHHVVISTPQMGCYNTPVAHLPRRFQLKITGYNVYVHNKTSLRRQKVSRIPNVLGLQSSIYYSI